MKNKDLQFSMEQLQSMLKRNGLGPEQRSALEEARRQLKLLWRKPNPTRLEVCRVVRRVAEAIIKNFLS
jgi:hypothetical protein